MIKTYYQYIKENYSEDIKTQLLSHLNENKEDIESKGFDFDDVKNELDSVLSKLNESFLKELMYKISDIDTSDKQEFKEKFNNILIDITNELNMVSENFFTEIKDKTVSIISKIVNYISDRIYTIFGLATLGLGSYFAVIGNIGAISTDFSKPLIGGILLLGITALSFGKKNDNYQKNKNEE
jgi:hypothetical protein